MVDSLSAVKSEYNSYITVVLFIETLIHIFFVFYEISEYHEMFLWFFGVFIVFVKELVLFLEIIAGVTVNKYSPKKSTLQ